MSSEDNAPIVEVPNVYDGSKPKIEPGFLERMDQSFQIWMLQNPDSFITKMRYPTKSLVQGIKANSPPYMIEKRDMWGPNFCVAGEVVLGEWASLEKAIVHTPHARTFRLGASILDGKTIPRSLEEDERKGRILLGVTMSSKAAKKEGPATPGVGLKEATRQAIIDYLTGTEAAKERQNDETSERLLQMLVEDFKTMDVGLEGDFYNEPHRGLSRFMSDYIHYVLFGLNPLDEENKETFELFRDFYYQSKATVYWFRAVSMGLRVLNAFEAREWPEKQEKLIEIYKKMPSLENFVEDPKYENLSKLEFAQLCVPLMGIASLVGPHQLIRCAMGESPFPEYVGHEAIHRDFDVKKVWDKLDLDDDDEIVRFIFECGRLWTPVSATHHVAQEDFTTTIGGKEYTFPKGTIINIPIIFGMLDEGLWGESTFDFDHNRKNLCPYSMIFHSVGDRHGGRRCAGREIALPMITKILKATGKVRRAKQQENA